MKIAVLTSSRADYSIYLPLLKELRSQKEFQLDIIAFGTHVSRQFGYTVKHIEEDGFNVKYKIESLVMGDSPEAVAAGMGLTTTRFSSIWGRESYDLVFTLGDRFEMFAAAASAVPFNVRMAHISGGETTLGAIDNVFRHSLTLMSNLHFTSTEEYRKKVISLTGSEKGVYNVGALSIDNLKHTALYSIEEFKARFGIDLANPTILITFHPETVSFEQNEHYVTELIAALEQCNDHQLLITMPNADTSGNMVRERLMEFIDKTGNAFGVESLGTIGYLSCMKHCSFMLGNTSSGFVEASFFPKYVINIGNRQKGRIVTPNIINCAIRKEDILEAIAKVKISETLSPITVYGDGTAAKKIVNILKEERERLQ